MIPRMRTSPLLNCDSRSPTFPQNNSILPPKKAVMAGALPWEKCTMANWAPVIFWNWRMAEGLVALDPRRRDPDLLRIRLGGVDHVLQGLEGTVRLDRKEPRVDHVQRQELKALPVVGGLAGRIQVADDGGRKVGIPDGVAVGLGLGQRRVSDLSAGARLVHHHHGCAEFFLHPAGQNAGPHVAASPCRKAHKDLDGLALLGKIGRPGGRRQNRAGQNKPTISQDHHDPSEVKETMVQHILTFLSMFVWCGHKHALSSRRFREQHCRRNLTSAPQSYSPMPSHLQRERFPPPKELEGGRDQDQRRQRQKDNGDGALQEDAEDPPGTSPGTGGATAPSADPG